MSWNSLLFIFVLGPAHSRLHQFWDSFTIIQLISIIFWFNLSTSADYHSSQHFQKIRKEARSGGSNNGGSSPVRPAPVFKVTKPSTSAKSTPRKPKSTTDSFQTANGSFSTKNGSFDNSYVDDDEEMTTPVKRQRTVKMEGQGNSQSAPVFKIEGQGVEHEPIDLENDE
jgi:hypothetical protein